MPWPEGKTKSALAGTGTAGMEVLREIRTNNSTVPVIVYSAIQDSSIIDALDSDSHVSFFSKWNSPSLKDFVAEIQRVLKLPLNTPPPQPFIVHGRNDAAKLAIKNYLQNTLHLPEPIILHEQSSMGRTVMEKFEDYAAQSSVAFVLLTPDDTVAIVTDSNDSKRRARQNVIYELGYFHGHFGRHSGRVILLHQGELDLPSDLAGVVYIDISAGIESAGEAIRKELANVV
jgi:predicted nucleotide-binding protein